MKNKTFCLTALAGVILLVLNSCSGIKVISDYDNTVDFTKYKTFEYYGWAEESNKILNDLDERRIESAFASEFLKRGLKLVDSGGDLIVTLFIVVEQKTQTTAHTTNMGGGYYGGFYGYGPGWGWGPSHSTTTFHEYNYEQGTLVCDVFDAEAKNLVWEGIGTGTIKEDPQGREKNIPVAIEKIMESFPVPLQPTE